MIKAVIFDCFGVLTEDGWLAFCGVYRTEENEEALRYINYQVDKGLLGYDDFLSRACEITGADRKEAHSMITTTHHPNTVLFGYAQKLKAAGYSVSVISNVGDELNTYLPQKYVDLFDEATLSYRVHAVKPEAAIYEHHIEKLGVAANECVFIDDREVNVVGAKAVGMESVLYTSAHKLRDQLTALNVSVD